MKAKNLVRTESSGRWQMNAGIGCTRGHITSHDWRLASMRAIRGPHHETLLVCYLPPHITHLSARHPHTADSWGHWIFYVSITDVLSSSSSPVLSARPLRANVGGKEVLVFKLKSVMAPVPRCPTKDTWWSINTDGHGLRHSSSSFSACFCIHAHHRNHTLIGNRKVVRNKKKS